MNPALESAMVFRSKVELLEGFLDSIGLHAVAVLTDGEIVAMVNSGSADVTMYLLGRGLELAEQEFAK